ncbi:ketoacyl-ACP synthase III [Candidatus Woesearchaeota archaeon]|nr:ketoacyl-ACP synthase III [Candidatus Woesearchaeota archaeon]
MVNAVILGTGYYVPNKRVTNADFEGKTLYEHDGQGNRTGKSVVTGDAAIVGLSGIRERRYAAEDQEPCDIGAIAVRRALRNAGLTKDSLEGIIVATVTDQQQYPSCAQKIQYQLDARNASFTKDVNNACAGGPSVLEEAALRIMYRDLFTNTSTGIYAVVGVEKLTSMLDFEDPDMNDVLFGDGAGAFIVGPTEDKTRGIMATYSDSIPEDGNIGLILRDQRRLMRMTKGHRVYKVAIPALITAFEELMKKTGWNKEEILLVPHQANEGISERAREKLGLRKDQVINTIYKYGNTSAASTFISYAVAQRRGVIKPGKKVIIVAFGASMGVSAAALVA